MHNQSADISQLVVILCIALGYSNTEIKCYKKKSKLVGLLIDTTDTYYETEYLMDKLNTIYNFANTSNLLTSHQNNVSKFHIEKYLWKSIGNLQSNKIQFLFTFRGQMDLDQRLLNKIIISGTSIFSKCRIIVLIENDLNLDLPFAYQNKDFHLVNNDTSIESSIICFKGDNLTLNFYNQIDEFGKNMTISEMYNNLSKSITNLELLVSNTRINIDAPIFRTY